ncbi:MAG TPA: ABC transporter permease [Aggregatilineales bacterium]|nr:ABC transporter permease [Aggregatilineales bacterium]
MPDLKPPYPVTYIRPLERRLSLNLDLNELRAYRELLYFLVWRDVKVRYKQTVLGIGWAILQPFIQMVIFSIFFGRLAGLDSDGVPYPLFSYTALVPWSFFAAGLQQSAISLVDNHRLIRKVYFPRLFIPTSRILSALVDFVLAFIVLVGMMLYYGHIPGLKILMLPPLILLMLVTVWGVGLWLSALNVLYRDVRYLLPFIIQAWLFITPVVYSSNLLSSSWQVIYSLNPMVGVIEGFRWILLDTNTAPGSMILVSAAGSILITLAGIWYFQHLQETFADVI